MSKKPTPARINAVLHRNIERLVWGLIALIPLLGLVVFACSASGLAPAPISTGDGMMDDYLRTVQSRGRLTDSLTGDLEYTLPDLSLGKADFDKLALKWGADPRFPLLRARCESDETVVSTEGYHPDWSYDSPQYNALLSSSRQQTLDSGSLYKLFRLEQRRSFELYRDEVHPVNLGNKPSWEALRAYHKELRGFIDTRNPAEAQALSALAKAAPDEALPHYLLASAADERGDYAGALAELQAGNAAPQLSLLQGEPQDYFQRLLSSPEGKQDAVLTGICATWSYGQSYSNSFRDTKYCINDLCDQALARNDRAALDSLFQCSLRQLTAEHSDMLQYMTAYNCSRNFLQKVQDSWAGKLSAEQDARLTQMLVVQKHEYRNLVNLRQRGRTFRASQFSASSQPSAGPQWQVWLSDYRDKLLGQKLSNLSMLRDNYLDEADMAKAIAQAQGRLKQLGSYSFQTLDWAAGEPSYLSQPLAPDPSAASDSAGDGDS